MPDLFHTLQKHDLGFLKIVASAWGIELSAPDVHTALPVVVNGILNHSMIDEFIESLPEEAQSALSVLMHNEGRMAWVAFTRQFGELRRMGAARRDRERPDLKPAWTTEILWYRALIGRDFLDLPGQTEPQEYAYIPDDVLMLLPTLQSSVPPPPGRPASPVECAYPTLASSIILDDACTLLAALRLKRNDQELNDIPLEIPRKFVSAEAEPRGEVDFRMILKGLLSAAHLLDDEGLPHPEQTRAFLEAPRGKALAQMVQSWVEDRAFNELRLLPGLKFEGEWSNDPQSAREAILNFISQVPENQWWNLASFVDTIHKQQPDFQRPAGDYDSWFIRQESGENGPSGGAYLRGFNSWDEVDGALVRFLIIGPMHWLGLLDLASSKAGSAPVAFRLSRWFALLVGSPLSQNRNPLPDLPLEDAPVHLSAEGRLHLGMLTPRAVRYQIARFCQWETTPHRLSSPRKSSSSPSSSLSPREKGPGDDGTTLYAYRITPAALERARSQGLRPSQLINLLRRHADGPLPPSLIQALERWEQSGTQAVIEKVTLLRVTSPEILAALRKSRANRFLAEALNETTVLVRPGMEEQLAAALAEAGYLGSVMLG